MLICKKSKVQSNEDALVKSFDESFDECRKHIYKAIDCLAVSAGDDPRAKEAIANLSVVLMELD